ncbi:MAG: LysR family transcriptional regulator [Clostridia bacterium]|nr:LysR family transcriptional regulator [Clostridia bacterium]
MRIETLQAFLKLIELGSFTAAANEMYMSQSTLSKQINELENDLGQKLLERSTRSVVATSAGRALQIHALRIVDEWNAIKSRMCNFEQQEKDMLLIGYTTSEQLQFIVAGLKSRQWQKRSVEVLPQRKHPNDILSALRDGTLDCAVMHQPTLHDGEGIRAQCLASPSLNAIVSVDSPLSRQKALTLKDVSRYIDVRCRHSRDPYYYDAIDEAFIKAGIAPPKRIETGESEELELLACRPGCMSLCPSLYPAWEKFVSIPITDCEANFDFLFVRLISNDNMDLDLLYQAIYKTLKS